MKSTKLADQANSQELRVLLRERRDSGRLESSRRHELLAQLLEAGHPVERRSSDCARPAMAVLQVGDDEEVVTPGTPWIRIAAMTAEQVVTNLADLRSQRELSDPGQWTPWFPVIDFGLCTNCMQCLSFCLFDVYGADENGQIQVQNEDNCKTNCPACSRVCPEVAILFPKYGKGPINGDVVRKEDIQKESMKVDISALLGGDIYSSLRDRSDTARKRFSTERDESKALLERKRCLKELKESLDIPDEVLMTLPSAGEIEERTRRAKEKAERRRAASQTIADQEASRPAPSPEEWDI
jgi:Pyruvate/2-oxoacid:ferredoxin oxidoreductase delta subunit